MKPFNDSLCEYESRLERKRSEREDELLAYDLLEEVWLAEVEADTDVETQPERR